MYKVHIFNFNFWFENLMTGKKIKKIFLKKDNGSLCSDAIVGLLRLRFRML